MMNLRLTVRKYKDFLQEPEKKLFMSKYSKMIEDLDDTDVSVFKRLQGSSSDNDVKLKLERTIKDFKAMMAVIPAPRVTNSQTWCVNMSRLCIYCTFPLILKIVVF